LKEKKRKGRGKKWAGKKEEVGGTWGRFLFGADGWMDTP